MNRRRLTGTLVALLLPMSTALVVPTATAAVADALQAPPACATDDPHTNCVHAPTPDLQALPGPTYTSTYNPVNHQREITFVGTINQPHPTCPTGGIPAAAIPCTFADLSATARVYVPGAKAAADGVTATPDPSTPCAFTCTFTALFSGDYYGPATIILHFTVGDVIVAANVLSMSSYETTIQLPADPIPNLIHVVKPTVAYNGKLKNMKLQLAGKHGIPAKGAAGVILQMVTTGSGSGFVQDEDAISPDGSLEVVGGTKLTISKQASGNLTVRVMGWYAKAPSTSGGMFHSLVKPKRVKTAATLALASAEVPADATGVAVAVIAGKGTTVVGGVPVPHAQGHAQYLLLPLKSGLKLAVKNTKAVKVIVYGYTEPVHPVDTGLPVQLVGTAYPLSSIFNLPGSLGIT